MSGDRPSLKSRSVPRGTTSRGTCPGQRRRSVLPPSRTSARDSRRRSRRDVPRGTLAHHRGALDQSTGRGAAPARAGARTSRLPRSGHRGTWSGSQGGSPSRRGRQGATGLGPPREAPIPRATRPARPARLAISAVSAGVPNPLAVTSSYPLPVLRPVGHGLGPLGHALGPGSSPRTTRGQPPRDRTRRRRAPR